MMGGGMGGMGGMGGGLMGSLMKGAMGGMNRNPSGGQPQVTETVADDYDVARWKRADGLDAAAPTMVQTVRADWEKKKSEQQEKSPVKKFFSKFSRKKDTKSAAEISEPNPRPAGGTIVTPEMKKATQRINPAAERENAVEPPRRKSVPGTFVGKNYLGLSFRSEIDGFFTMNPVNSAILAVDNLGMGMLTLNQVTVKPEAKPAPEIYQGEVPQNAADQSVPVREQAGGLQNLIAQRTDTNYMNEFHKNREQQKYNVRIR